MVLVAVDKVPAVPLVGVFKVIRFPGVPLAVQFATVVTALTGMVMVDATVFVLEIVLNVLMPVML